MSAFWMARERAAIELELERRLPAAAAPPQNLHAAMRYGVLGGGKRLRPLLCRAAAEAVGGAPVDAAWDAACAVEFIHCYSLIHDDLPALDNDALRRGRPTCHIVYGEALAILAGDALLTLAFAQLGGATPAALPGMLRELASAAGTPAGMVAGQVLDVEAVRAGADIETVRAIHLYKTAAMIRAAVVLGGWAAGARPEVLETLAQFGSEIGLAFQIVDDLLDVTGAASELGKSAGKDEAQGKVTYPAVWGMEAAEGEARRLGAQAWGRIADWGAAAIPLRGLAEALVERRH